ncbi:MAG TPA: hypothetical protein VGL77_01030 [Armatimonadota bacterium]
MVVVLIYLGLAAFVLISGIVAVIVIVVGTVRRKGKWGVNLHLPVRCPQCHTALPMVRKPTSTEQAMWGGWTCPQCRAKVDKWGMLKS